METCIKCKKTLPDGAAYCPYCGRRQVPERKYHKRAHGTGSVYRLQGHRTRPWAACIRGVMIGYYQTRKDAEDALARLNGVTVREKYNWTFAEVYAAWKPLHFPDITEGTRGQYERSFAVFAPLHARKFRDLRTGDYQAILDAQGERSTSLLGKHKQLLTQLSAFAMENEIVTTDFAAFCRIRGRAATSHEPLTPDEIARIQGDGSEAARIVLMLLSTGMRIGELFKLRVEDYHDTYIIGGEKSDAGRDRVIPIRQEGRAHFEYFARRATGPLLLSGYTGNRSAANFRKREYYDLLDRLGIPRSKTPHSTRVSYITRAVDDGLSPAVLQKVVGHSDFSTTQKHYNRPSAEQLVRAVEESEK